jgi:hypothetical protein
MGRRVVCRLGCDCVERGGNLSARERHAIVHGEGIIVGDPLAGLGHSTIHADPAVLDELVCFFEGEISHQA